jgi:hypothetical protein
MPASESNGKLKKKKKQRVQENVVEELPADRKLVL